MPLAGDLATLPPALADLLGGSMPAAAPPPAQASTANPLVAGFTAGMHDVGALSGSAMQAFGRLSGKTGLEANAKAFAEAQQAAAQQSGRADLDVAPWREGGGGWKAALPWLAYQTARQLPQMGVQLAGGMLMPEVAVPTALERFGAAVPQMLGGGRGLAAEAASAAGKDWAKGVTGATIAGYPMAVGSMYQEANDRAAAGGGEATTGDAVKAMLMGAPYAALDAAGLAQKKSFATGLAQAGEGGVAGIAKTIAKKTLAGAAEEMPQEAVQTAMEQSFRPDLSTDQKVNNVIDAAITGGAVGGVLGGAASGVGSIRQLKAMDPNAVTGDDLKAGIDQTVKGTPAAPADAALSAVTNAPAGVPQETAPVIEPSGQMNFPGIAPGADPYEGVVSQKALRSALGALETAAQKGEAEPTDMATMQRLRERVGLPAQPDAPADAQLELFAAEPAAPEAPAAPKTYAVRDTLLQALSGVPNAAKSNFVTQFDETATMPDAINRLKAAYDRIYTRDESRDAAPRRWGAERAVVRKLLTAFGITDADGKPFDFDKAAAAKQADIEKLWDKAQRNPGAAAKIAEQAQAAQAELRMMRERKALLDSVTSGTETGAAPVSEGALNNDDAERQVSAEERPADEGWVAPSVEVLESAARAAEEGRVEKGRAEEGKRQADVGTGPQLGDAGRQAGDVKVAGSAAPSAAPATALTKDAEAFLKSINDDPNTPMMLVNSKKDMFRRNGVFDKNASTKEMIERLIAKRGAAAATVAPSAAPAAEATPAPAAEATPAPAAEAAPVAPGLKTKVKVAGTSKFETPVVTAPRPTAPRSMAAQSAVNKKPTKLVAEDVRPVATPTNNKIAEMSRRWQQQQKDGRKALLQDGPAATTQRDADIRAAVESGPTTAQQVLEYLEQTSTTPGMKELAQRLRRTGYNGEVRFAPPPDADTLSMAVPEGQIVGASFDPDSDAIELHTYDNLEHKVLHEAVHATTLRAIDAGGVAAQRMAKLYEHARRQLGYDSEEYGAQDVREFVAEAFANPEFRKLLSQLKPMESAGKPKSLWQSFKDLIFRLLKGPQKMRAFIDEVLDAGDALIDENTLLPTQQTLDETVGGQRAPLLESARREGKAMFAKAQTAVGRVLDNQDTWSKLKNQLKELMLGVQSVLHIVERNAALFDVEGMPNWLREFARTNSARATARAWFSQMFDLAYSKMAKLDAQGTDRLNKLMEYTVLRIDPRKTWDQHTWLHGARNRALMETRVNQARQLYSAKETSKEVRDAYAAAVLHNEAHRYAAAALAIYNHVNGDAVVQASLNMANPMDDFIAHTEYRDDVKGARDYWKDTLDQMVADVKKYEDERNAEIKVITAAKGDTDKAREIVAIVAPLKALRRQIEDITDEMKRAPYFHLGRSGDQFVSFKLRTLTGDTPHPDGGVGKKGDVDPMALQALADFLAANGFDGFTLNSDPNHAKAFIRLETEAQRLQLETLLKSADAKKLLADNSELKGGHRHDEKLEFGITPDSVQKIIRGIESSYATTEGMTDDQKKAVAAARARAVATFKDLFLDMLPDTAIAKVLTRRDYVPGYNKDMVHAFAQRAQVGANSLANMSMAGRMNDVMKGMQGRIDEAKSLYSGNHPNVLTMQQVKAELVKRASLKQSTDGGFLDYARALNHTYFLGLSPSYVMVNMTQVPVLLWPQLAKHHGFSRSAKAIASVTGDAFKILGAVMRSGREIGGLRAFDAIVTEKALKEALGDKDPRVKTLMEVISRGNIDIGSAARELARVAEKRGGALDDFMTVAGSFGYYSEVLTRLTAALAADKLYTDKVHGGLVRNKEDYIDHVVEQSMLNYSNWNTARAIGKDGVFGQASPLMFSFMNYQMQVLEKMYREFHGLLKGDAETKQQSARFLLGHAAALVVTAGALGLPFVTAAAGAYDRLRNAFGEESDVKSDFRKWMAATFGKDVGEVFSRGLPRAFGFDISSRAGEQDLLPMSKLLADRRKAEDALDDWASSMMGSPFSILKNIGKGLRSLAGGDLVGGLHELAPSFLRGPLGAAQMAMDGYVDRNGNKWPVQPGARDILVQALGLRPADKAEYQEQKHALSERKELAMQEAKSIRKNLATALENGDAADIQRYSAEAQQFDAKHPEWAIMPRIGSEVTRRAKDRAISSSFGVPLGTSVRELGAARDTGWANWQRTN